MIDPSEYSNHIEVGEDGIWFAKSEGEISYPKEGNRSCFGIEEDSYWFRHRNECIATAVNIFPPSGPVFDIGGGNGFVSTTLRTRGYDVILVEPGPEGARNARSRGLPIVICSTFEDARFTPHTIAAVGLFDVLEHIENDREFVLRLAELMTPNGRLYVTVPAFKFLWSTNDDGAGHFRRYTVQSLISVIRSGGFHIDYHTYFFQPLMLPLFLLRALPSKVGLRKIHDRRRTAREHTQPKGTAGWILTKALRREQRSIARERIIRFGTSLLLVARYKGISC